MILNHLITHDGLWMNEGSPSRCLSSAGHVAATLVTSHTQHGENSLSIPPKGQREGLEAASPTTLPQHPWQGVLKDSRALHDITPQFSLLSSF